MSERYVTEDIHSALYLVGNDFRRSWDLTATKNISAKQYLRNVLRPQRTWPGEIMLLNFLGTQNTHSSNAQISLSPSVKVKTSFQLCLKIPKQIKKKKHYQKISFIMKLVSYNNMSTDRHK
jgi:hypothetical protein